MKRSGTSPSAISWTRLSKRKSRSSRNINSSRRSSNRKEYPSQVALPVDPSPIRPTSPPLRDLRAQARPNPSALSSHVSTLVLPLGRAQEARSLSLVTCLEVLQQPGAPMLLRGQRRCLLSRGVTRLNRSQRASQNWQRLRRMWTA